MPIKKEGDRRPPSKVQDMPQRLIPQRSQDMPQRMIQSQGIQ